MDFEEVGVGVGGGVRGAFLAISVFLTQLGYSTHIATEGPYILCLW